MEITLITGGARSGKSRRGEHLAAKAETSVVYLATCPRQIDDEMEERIDRHVQDRAARGWKTIENRYDISEVANEHRGHVILMDCLTLWLYHFQRNHESENWILGYLKENLQSLPHDGKLLVISNEIGMGLVPQEAVSRKFRDMQGWANQIVADHATSVEFMVAGYPMTVK